MIPFDRTVYARSLSAALLFGLLASSSRAGDDAPGKVPRPASESGRFRAMEPGERLKLVEKLATTKTPFTAVTRGDLVAAIVERGVVEPVNAVDVICKVKTAGKEGAPSTTVKWFIDDGTAVKKGDKLAVLDDSAIRDQIEVARVKVKQAESAKVEAENALELTKVDTEIDVRLAAIDVRLAEIDLKDPPPGQGKPLLELKLERARLLYDRTRAHAKATQKRAETEYRANLAAWEREAQRLKDIEAELEHCVLTAPIDGLAVHYVPESSRFAAAVKVAVGDRVREGQKLVRVVDLTKMAITTRIHEAVISSLRTGQPTKVRIDALPNRDVSGKVAQVSTVASADWRMTDVKVYPVTIALENAPSGLKPQMTAEVKITTGERKGVLLAPQKAVWTAGRDRICFIKVGDELIERKVVTGASNATAIEIKDGLKEGDLVLADAAAVLSPAGHRSPPPAK